MKLSYVTGGYVRQFIRNDADAIEYLAGIGYRTLDYTLDNPLSIISNADWLKDAAEIKQVVKRHGIRFAQSHAPFCDGVDTDGSLMQKLKRALEICAYLEIPLTVVHLFKNGDVSADEMYRENAEYFSEIYPMLDKYGIDLCIENIGDFTQGLHLSSSDDLLAAVKAMNHPRVHVCWDTGHANVVNREQYSDIIKLGSQLKALHVHDNFYPIKKGDGLYSFDAHNFPLYGNVNFDAVLQGLIDIDYKGAFSLETETPNRRGHHDFMRNGEFVAPKLKPIPFWMREDADRMLYKIGRYMLQTYGLWED